MMNDQLWEVWGFLLTAYFQYSSDGQEQAIGHCRIG